MAFFFASILLISISIQLYFRLDRCRPPSPPFIRRGSLFRVFHDLVHNLAPSSAAVNSESVTMSNVCSKQKKGEGKKARLIQHNFYTRSFNASYLFIYFFYPLNKFSGLTEFESTQKSCSSCLAIILPCDVSFFWMDKRQKRKSCINYILIESRKKKNLSHLLRDCIVVAYILYLQTME